MGEAHGQKQYVFVNPGGVECNRYKKYFSLNFGLMETVAFPGLHLGLLIFKALWASESQNINLVLNDI
jgi:hypothetical protein